MIAALEGHGELFKVGSFTCEMVKKRPHHYRTDIRNTFGRTLTTLDIYRGGSRWKASAWLKNEPLGSPRFRDTGYCLTPQRSVEIWIKRHAEEVLD